jgi:transketolase
MIGQRQQFPMTMERLMAADAKICVLLGDISVHSFRHVANRWPDRCLNMGTCEQAMVGMGAGMALEGYVPVLHSIDGFLVRRAFEQILLDFGHQRLPGLFVTVGHDRDYANMGPSHHGDHCADLMRTVPNMRVIEPTSAHEVDTELAIAVQARSLAYVRLRA